MENSTTQYSESAAYLTIPVPPVQNGCTLSHFLKTELGLTSREISRLKFVKGGLLINGTRARATAVLQAGDEVAVCLRSRKNPVQPNPPEDRDMQDTAGKSPGLSELPESPKLTELPEIQILYEDACFFAVNKPSGIVCHRSHGYWNSSLFDAVKWSEGELRASDAKCIGRLDKDTSGIVLYAKDQITAAHLSRQRTAGQLKKTYHALCTGADFSASGLYGTVDAPIGKDPSDRRKWMICGKDAKKAVTHYQVLRQDPEQNQALVTCTLKTGRTHQIRIHMASLGHPLVGDPLYGDGREGLTRACLHCCKLELIHPYTGMPIVIECPIGDGAFGTFCCSKMPKSPSNSEQ